MERYFEERIDPRRLLGEARSIIVMLYNYAPAKDAFHEKEVKIAKYAYGRDYHRVLRKKLKRFVGEMRKTIGNVEARPFVDSSPVMETVWAHRAGLGWKGKNSLLINKKKGSFFFICGIITDLPAEKDLPATDHCGSCTRCIDHCPTHAILPNRSIQADRCLSYLTIEMKKEIPPALGEKMGGWVFGCDICQDVCPWNRRTTPHTEADFSLPKAVENLDTKGWYNLSREQFGTLFRGSALKRTKYEGLMRNLRALRRRKSRSVDSL